MKIINKVVIISFFSAVIFSACTNLEVIESDSEFVLTTDDGTQTADPVALLDASYKALSALTDQANIYSLSAHTSDLMIPPTRGVDWGDNGVWRTLHAHSWDASHAWVKNAWNQLNERVYNVNRVLASNPSPSQAAQAKFLKAFYMYQVMDLWGQVPFREVTEGVDVDPRVYTRAEAFDIIVADLEAAAADLEVLGPGQNVTASKAAANALLARLHLNKAVYTAANAEGPYTFDNADMQKVADYCDAVAADGYSLDDDYFNVFTAGSASETIFTSIEGSPENRWYMTLNYDQNPSGWNGFTTLADFYDSFEEEDQRIGKPALVDGTEYSGIAHGFLLGDQFDDNGDPLENNRQGGQLNFKKEIKLAGAAVDEGIRVIKYHPATAGNYILLRYADVHLMKAEALMRSGDTAGALALVNELRTSRGASKLENLDEATMLAERGKELYWEGIRRTDQVRFGTFTSTWHEKTNTDAYRVLFPIPGVALASNPNLAQNPGY